MKSQLESQTEHAGLGGVQSERVSRPTVGLLPYPKMTPKALRQDYGGILVFFFENEFISCC